LIEKGVGTQIGAKISIFDQTLSNRKRHSKLTWPNQMFPTYFLPDFHAAKRKHALGRIQNGIYLFI
jgi:hypothetical protein